ncbi:MAG: DNA topoisomerase IV subunit A [Alphaproteobacteria bacterium]|nr:DNA topoisomerase IV subunit A [Alphaproteobacteria bacterium]
MAKALKKNSAPPSPPPEIGEQTLRSALSERYLAYAISTITSRALPDVRDGLKPVQRRLLYAMRELNLKPDLAPKKSARVVGDVIGQYHPHGDTAVYDAMVRLAQDFAQRYPLVDGQGNFGNIDGDNAAAMRYTEARLTEIAALLLKGLNNNTVDFRATYDGSGQEPVVLPAAFPNLLANGASGIAVGMATSIPPHNVVELCDALRHLIKHPNARTDKLVSFIQGPDFPTGGILVEAPENILSAYETGRGSFRVRARWQVDEGARGMWQVVVTDIPYQVTKSRLIEKIAALIEEKKLPLLDDVRDESADDVRLVLVPKSRNVEASVLMESLFRNTELENRISLNMNVLDAQGVPQVMNLRACLQAFLDHRHVVLVRASQHRLAQIDARLEILEALLIAYLNVDEVIKIIRREDEPKPVMMKRFSLSETQAEAILNMRLRQLRKLEEMEIKGEEKELKAERKTLKDLLGDESLRWEKIDQELVELKKMFGPASTLGKRRTDIGTPPADITIPIESVIEREPITIICSAKGWIRVHKGHVSDDTARSAIKYKEGDSEGFVLPAETTDKILLWGSNGRCYTLMPDKLPGGRGFGEPVRLLIDLPPASDIIALHIYRDDLKMIVASKEGHGFVVNAPDALAQTKQGKQILNVENPQDGLCVVPVAGNHVATIGTNRKMLVFPLAELPEMSRGKGVLLQRYQDGHLSDITTLTLKQGLSWISGSRTKTEADMRPWLGKRAQAGRLAPHGFNRNNKFVSC